MVHTLLVSVPLCGISITVCMVSFRRAESPGAPETCALLEQVLARNQPEQQRAAWLGPLEMWKQSRLGHS